MNKIIELDNSRIDSVIYLFRNVIRQMRDRGIDQWDECYPSESTIEKDIENGWAFGIADGKTVSAYVAINSRSDPEYSTVSWTLNHSKSMTVHRLAVDPLFQGRGMAKALMHFVEDHVRSCGGTAIRLDAFSLNPAALALYNSLEYRKAGEVEFRKGNFAVFEKAV